MSDESKISPPAEEQSNVLRRLEGFSFCWHSNAPWNPSGYGNQTNEFVPKLLREGAVGRISSFTHKGVILDYKGMIVLPSGQIEYGGDVMVKHAANTFGGDSRGGAFISLIDVMVLPTGELQKLHWFPWIPIDHDPIPPMVMNTLQNGLTTGVPIAMSKWGAQMLEQAGFRPLYVPHGVDTVNYLYPDNRDKSRERLGVPENTFLVSMVAANIGDPSRKKFDLAIEAFAKFYHRHKDEKKKRIPHLYLHTEILGTYGVNIQMLINRWQLPVGSVSHCDQYEYITTGFDNDHMRQVYSATDVLLHPAAGEGFGIPIVEAQACGTPVIVTDFSAMSELCGAGHKVRVNNMFKSHQQSFQANADCNAIVAALEDVYSMSHKKYNSVREQARRFATDYDSEKVMTEHMIPACQYMDQTVKRRNTSVTSFDERLAQITGIGAENG